MEVIKFILFIFLLMAAWNYVILPSNLDSSRDQLFDLRDELRAHFIEKGWDISLSKYGETRAAINGYLRFIDETSIWRLMFINSIIMNDRKSGAKSTSPKRRAGDRLGEIDLFVGAIRRRALKVVISHAVSSSFLLHVMAFLLVPIFVISASFGAAKSGFNACSVAFANLFRNFPSVVSSGFVLAEAYIGRIFFRESVVEQYSVRYR
jgi:hypothetical protein